jgi:hypothetical protein
MSIKIISHNLLSLRKIFLFNLNLSHHLNKELNQFQIKEKKIIIALLKKLKNNLEKIYQLNQNKSNHFINLEIIIEIMHNDLKKLNHNRDGLVQKN